jgi:hypothetical protein
VSRWFRDIPAFVNLDNAYKMTIYHTSTIPVHVTLARYSSLHAKKAAGESNIMHGSNRLPARVQTKMDPSLHEQAVNKSFPTRFNANDGRRSSQSRTPAVELFMMHVPGSISIHNAIKLLKQNIYASSVACRAPSMHKHPMYVPFPRSLRHSKVVIT